MDTQSSIWQWLVHDFSLPGTCSILRLQCGMRQLWSPPSRSFQSKRQVIKQVITAVGYHDRGSTRRRCGDVEQKECTGLVVKQFLLFSGKFQGLADPTGGWTNAWGHWYSLTLVQSLHLKDIFEALWSFSSNQFRAPWTPAPLLFLSQRALRFRSTWCGWQISSPETATKRLSDLPKGIYWVTSRNGNKTQSPDTGASSPSLDTSPNRENKLLKYQIALGFWWVSNWWANNKKSGC